MQDQHLLTEIAASLAQIAQAMQSQNRPVQPLGFIQNQVETVYVNLVAGNKDGWYRLVDDVIDGRAIRRAETLPPEFWGYIIDIKFPKKER